MKQQLIDFLKKNIRYVILILAVIAIIIYIVCRERHFARLSADLAALRVEDEIIKRDRDKLREENIILTAEQLRLHNSIDSIKVIQANLAVQLKVMIAKHKREIDSLLNVNIPNDTVYVRLQPIYPNMDGGLLEYPFSGSQIRQIYSDAISFPRLQKQYGLQSNLLASCNDLNRKYGQSEKNLLGQIDNLNSNIAACDQQIKIRDDQLKLTQKQLKRKTFWSWTQKAAIVIIGGYAILK